MRVSEKNLEAHELTFDETRDLGSSFHTAKGGSSPRPSSNQLESTRRFGVSCKKLRETGGITYGRVEISFPAAATPMIVETPHPL